jgi:hypothetical protein
VDQPGRSRGRSRREVGLLDEGDRKATERRVTRDPRADDAATDDENIDGAVAERPHRLFTPADYLFALLYLSI